MSAPRFDKLRRLRDVALAASVLGLVLSGCRDEPLDIPSKPKPPEAMGGEAAGGEGTGADGGTAPTTGGTAGTGNGGSMSSAGTAGVSPMGGMAGTGGSAGMGGMAGTGGKPPLLNCGDGKPDAGEECDDGNEISGDGCSAQCQSSCETCEKNVCQEYDEEFENRYDNCYKMPGVAKGGPAEGVARSELCRAMVDCVRETGCTSKKGEYGYDVIPCYCQNPSISDCNTPDFIKGPCVRQFQEASEQAGIGVKVYGQLTAAAIPLGAGYRLLNDCDKYVCRDECVPEQVPEGEVTTISASIGATPNEAGESALGNLVADATRSAGMTDFAIVKAAAVEGVYDLAFAKTPNRAADADGRVLLTELLAVETGYSDLGRPARGQFLRTMKLTGQLVYDAMNQDGGALYVSGMTYTRDFSKPAGSQIVEIRKNGAAIDKLATYTLTADNLITGTAILQATDAVDTTTSPESALVTYVKSLPKPVAPPALGRIQLAN